MIHVAGPQLFERQYGEVVDLQNLVITGSGDTALTIIFPDAPSVVWPTVNLRNIVVLGEWKRAYRFVNCWNGRAQDLFALGPQQGLSDGIVNGLDSIAFDVGGSMDFYLTNCCANYYGVGVRFEDTHLVGQAEGCRVNGGWLMNVRAGVEFWGFGSGGWPTPLGYVNNVHIAATQHCLRAHNYCGLHFTDNDLYGAHYAATPTGAYLTFCKESYLTSNRVWDNKGGFMAGFVLDNCEDCVITGGGVSRECTVGAVLTPSTINIRAGNVNWGAPVYNLSGANLIHG